MGWAKRKIIMNVTQMKINIIINDIRKIAEEIENLKKRVSDLELEEISINMKDKYGRNENEKNNN
jgi:hypothetical protein